MALATESVRKTNLNELKSFYEEYVMNRQRICMKWSEMRAKSIWYVSQCRCVTIPLICLFHQTIIHSLEMCERALVCDRLKLQVSDNITSLNFMYFRNGLQFVRRKFNYDKFSAEKCNVIITKVNKQRGAHKVFFSAVFFLSDVLLECNFCCCFRETLFQ